MINFVARFNTKRYDYYPTFNGDLCGCKKLPKAACDMALRAIHAAIFARRHDVDIATYS
ncbi:MAG: hypothetical protein HYU79_02105 [Nitrosomonadales bacterium]|nr:hypothetical protein [Nitrosomonadales bacterium]